VALAVKKTMGGSQDHLGTDQRSGTGTIGDRKAYDIRELISSINDWRSSWIERVVDDDRGGRCGRGKNERHGAGE